MSTTPIIYRSVTFQEKQVAQQMLFDHISTADKRSRYGVDAAAQVIRNELWERDMPHNQALMVAADDLPDTPDRMQWCRELVGESLRERGWRSGPTATEIWGECGEVHHALAAQRGLTIRRVQNAINDHEGDSRDDVDIGPMLSYYVNSLVTGWDANGVSVEVVARMKFQLGIEDPLALAFPPAS